MAMEMWEVEMAMAMVRLSSYLCIASMLCICKQWSA